MYENRGTIIIINDEILDVTSRYLQKLTGMATAIRRGKIGAAKIGAHGTPVPTVGAAVTGGGEILLITKENSFLEFWKVQVQEEEPGISPGHYEFSVTTEIIEHARFNHAFTKKRSLKTSEINRQLISINSGLRKARQHQNQIIGYVIVR